MTLFEIPLPHVVLQVPHWLHLQSMGHALKLQLLPESPRHSLPPYLAGISTALTRFPFPQVLLQADHWLHLQSMGQDIALVHSLVTGPVQFSPPFTASYSIVLCYSESKPKKSCSSR